jgi:hypothetical protein
MKLVRIAKGRWEVLAVVDHRGRCQVLDFLDQLRSGFRAAQEFLNLFLRVYLPLEGAAQGQRPSLQAARGWRLRAPAPAQGAQAQGPLLL